MSDIVEEPVAPLDAEVVQTEAEPAAVEAQPPDLYALLGTEFGGDPDPALDELAAALTPDKIKDLPLEARVLMRALVQADAKRIAAAADARTAQETALAGREAKVEANRRAVIQQRQAFLDMATKVKPPGEKPTVDPLSAEGMQAHIEYAARKVEAERWAPIHEEQKRASEDAAWALIVDKHPELRDPKIGGDTGAFPTWFFTELNKGRDLTKEPPVMNAELAADLFFSQRKAAALESKAAQASTLRTADRAVAARAVGRSSGAGGSDTYAEYRALIKNGDMDAAMNLVAGNPALRTRVLAEARA
jgi:hypothetical protein